MNHESQLERVLTSNQHGKLLDMMQGEALTFREFRRRSVRYLSRVWGVRAAPAGADAPQSEWSVSEAMTGEQTGGTIKTVRIDRFID